MDNVDEKHQEFSPVENTLNVEHEHSNPNHKRQRPLKKRCLVLDAENKTVTIRNEKEVRKGMVTLCRHVAIPAHRNQIRKASNRFPSGHIRNR
jgi:hypothetical protein